MSLREEFSVLRGKPIELIPRAEEVPCNETSDCEKLCKHPVVSVWMLAYNHSPYIRQAVESVVSQVTDFEYEVVIGEDASTDDTRKICFDLQREYPDKIRVLWSERNVYRMGGSGVRVLSRCRGEYLALLEGDDYWLDERRLQKQVNAFRANPSVALCFGEKQDFIQASGVFRRQNTVSKRYRAGFISSAEFLRTEAIVPPFTAMYRASALSAAKERYEILGWRLNLGDLRLWRGLATFGDVYVFHDLFATYRVHGGGVMHTNFLPVKIDAAITRLFYFRKAESTPWFWYYMGMTSLADGRLRQIAALRSFKERRMALAKILSTGQTNEAIMAFVGVVGVFLSLFGCSPALYLKCRAHLRRLVLCLFGVL